MVHNIFFRLRNWNDWPAANVISKLFSTNVDVMVIAVKHEIIHGQYDDSKIESKINSSFCCPLPSMVLPSRMMNTNFFPIK